MARKSLSLAIPVVISCKDDVMLFRGPAEGGFPFLSQQAARMANTGPFRWPQKDRRKMHRSNNVHTYIPTCLHTYIPTYLHTYIHRYIDTYIPTYIHYITLHYVTSHYITLRCITLRCITLHYIHTHIHTYISSHFYIKGLSQIKKYYI